MTRTVYVVDLAIADFKTAVADFRALFGMEGIPMWEEYEPSRMTRGMHFPVGGLQAFGLMAPTDRPTCPVPPGLTPAQHLLAKHYRDELVTRGEGANLIGFIATDLAQTQAEFEAMGIQFVSKEPWRVGDEHINLSEKVHGVTLCFAQHDPGHWGRWERGELRATWDTGLPAAPSGLQRRVTQAVTLEIAVRDLEAAATSFTRVFGTPRRVEAAALADGVRACDFLVGGLRTVRLVAVDRPAGARARLVAQFLERRGEGIMLTRFLVPEVRRLRAELEAEGVAFIAEPASAGACTQPIHGCAVEFVQEP
jgi:hypothetical protein